MWGIEVEGPFVVDTEGPVGEEASRVRVPEPNRGLGLLKPVIVISAHPGGGQFQRVGGSEERDSSFGGLAASLGAGN